MAIKRPRRSMDQDPFTDLLFNSLLAFTFLFLVTILFLNPPAKTGIIDPKAEMIITVKWEDGRRDDIDVWVEDPSGAKVWFKNPEVGLMHLDRDDRGMTNDMILVNGKEIINPLNQEVVTIRGTAPGEYVVNLYYYQTEDNRPVPVEVRVVKVNPALQVVYYGTVVLEQKDSELTAVRFTVTPNGSVSNINTIQKAMVPKGMI